MPANAEILGGRAASGLNVLHIFGLVRITKVLDSVVCTIAVDVVNAFRPETVANAEHNAMCFNPST